jgi:hypothetical protein
MVIQSPAFFGIPVSSGSAAKLNSSDPGQVFTFRGNDFLSPNTVLTNVNNFSKGANGGGDILGRNPSSNDILSITNRSAQDIFGANFGAPVAAQQVNPFTGTVVNVNGANFSPNATVFGAVTQTPSAAFLSDLANFNPLIWLNPSASNVTLGTMDSTNKIFGGNGLFPPAVNNGPPLFPFISPPQAPFSNFNIPFVGNRVTTLSQAQLFPITADTGSPFFNTTVTPVVVATNPNTQPFAALFGLFGLLLSATRQQA